MQLRDPMIVLLLCAGVLSISLRDFRDVVVIGVVVAVNTCVGVGQEIRADRALEALQRMTAPVARVWRDGALVVLPAAQIVPGDHLVVEAGDIVAADGELLDAVGLELNEAALTGESFPVAKQARKAESEAESEAEPDVESDVDSAALAGAAADHTESPTLIWAGTVVTRGRGTALVTAIGPHSAVGHIADLLGREPARQTPLQQRLRDLGRVLAVAAVGLSVVVMVSGLLRGRPWSEVVLTAVSLAVAAVPESLPAVVTLALALGARRMARSSAIVRRLAAVETLGSVTVLMTDKTGTLTQGAMSVERIWVPDQEYVVSGLGYAPEGDITVRSADGHRAVLASDHAALQRLLRDIVLCNDADLVAPDKEHPLWRPRGDTTEAALLAAAARADQGAQEQRARYPRVAEVPFDSVRKRMTTIHRLEAPGAYLVVCKGAPEALAQAPGLVRSFPLALRAEADTLAAGGFRVLVVADGTAADPDAGRAEHALDVVGLVALSDPPRRDAAGVVADVLAAGVKPVMVTGDHPSTAGAIAERLGIPGGVVTGAELETGLHEIERRELPGVFARTRPEQKFGIVAALQQQGQVVAMTGDGVNDAPALERADIGVAMGQSGTEVAKQAADVVLTDDRLSTIVLAISEGRRIYDNIRTFLRYGLAGGAAEVLVMLLGPSVGLAVPLLPGQILWINLLTHGLPGVAFGAERADPEGMHVPPRSPEESVLGAGLWQQVLVTGLVLCAAALGAGVLSPGSQMAQQSAVFLALGLGQLGVAIALRRPPEHGRVLSFLDLGVASSIVLQLAAVYVPPLSELLHTGAPVPGHLPVVVAFAAVPGLLVRAVRLLGRKRPR